MKIPKIEISVKLKNNSKNELISICSSKEAYNVLKFIFNEGTINWYEEMILICLNQANKVIGYYKVSSGGTTGTICDPKIIFTIALNCPGTTGLILSHNHPSGNLNPSEADKNITEKIKRGAALLDFRLIEHIIFTENGYYSFSDEGLI